MNLKAIAECLDEPGQFLSNIFSVPKSDGSHRLIINLVHLNEFIDCPHFKLEDYRTVRSLLCYYMYMGTLDIFHAYLHVAIDVGSRKYLRFRWKGKLYEFICLPFGLFQFLLGYLQK